MVVGVFLACECHRSRGTTRPHTAAVSRRVRIVQPPHGHGYFQTKSSTRLWQCCIFAVATGSLVPARSRTADCKPLLGWSSPRLLQCRFLKRSWPRSSAEPVCRRNGGRTRPRRTLESNSARLTCWRGSHVARLTHWCQGTGTPVHGLPAQLTPGDRPERQRTACPPKLVPR